MKECATCDFLGSSIHKRPCSECQDFSKWSGDEDAYEKPMTNADHIRSMSDEELAEFLGGVYDEEDGKFICGTTIIDYDQYRICDWLKQPKENTDER